MIVIDQSAEYISQDTDPYELIELIARTCYKSEPQGDAVGFVKRLHKSHHDAMLEHAYVFLTLDTTTMRCFLRLNSGKTKFLNIANDYISGSLRAWIEFFDNELSNCGYETEEMSIVNKVLYKAIADKFPNLFTEYVEGSTNGCNATLLSRQEFIQDVVAKYDNKGDWILSKLLPHTVKFTTNRGVSHELVRHRVASFAQESQRYVWYDKDKFGGQIKVIKPWFNQTDIDNWRDWNYAMLLAETMYKNMRQRGLQPQIARGVLPNDCATEIVVTATEEEWQHIVNLRYHGTTGAPHPQMKELIGLIYPTLQKESNGRII